MANGPFREYFRKCTGYRLPLVAADDKLSLSSSLQFDLKMGEAEMQCGSFLWAAMSANEELKAMLVRMFGADDALRILKRRKAAAALTASIPAAVLGPPFSMREMCLRPRDVAVQPWRLWLSRHVFLASPPFMVRDKIPSSTVLASPATQFEWTMEGVAAVCFAPGMTAVPTLADLRSHGGSVGFGHGASMATSMVTPAAMRASDKWCFAIASTQGVSVAARAEADRPSRSTPTSLHRRTLFLPRPPQTLLLLL